MTILSLERFDSIHQTNCRQTWLPRAQTYIAVDGVAAVKEVVVVKLRVEGHVQKTLVSRQLTNGEEEGRCRRKQNGSVRYIHSTPPGPLWFMTREMTKWRSTHIRRMESEKKRCRRMVLAAVQPHTEPSLPRKSKAFSPLRTHTAGRVLR